MNFNCGQDLCYVQPQCDSEFSSRINAVVLVKKNYAVDKTSSTAFLDSIYEGMLTGDVKAILNIRGSKARPETAELGGFGNQSIKVGNTSHTLEYVDQFIKENQAFYNAIRSGGSKYDLYYFTKELIWDASGSQITLYGDAVHTDGATDLLEGMATIKWVQKGSPLAIFDDYDSDEFLEGLYYEVTNSTYPNGQVTMAENATVVINMSASLNQYVVSSCGLVWTTDANETLANVFIDAETGVLTIEGNDDPGTFTFNVIVKDDCAGCVVGTMSFTVVLTAI
jgi:hypothetical protein